MLRTRIPGSTGILVLLYSADMPPIRTCPLRRQNQELGAFTRIKRVEFKAVADRRYKQMHAEYQFLQSNQLFSERKALLSYVHADLSSHPALAAILPVLLLTCSTYSLIAVTAAISVPRHPNMSDFPLPVSSSVNACVILSQPVAHLRMATVSPSEPPAEGSGGL
jgi:hypothetical protein